eukprot:9257847-Heterocapsa_arctica.AAC.1
MSATRRPSATLLRSCSGRHHLVAVRPRCRNHPDSSESGSQHHSTNVHLRTPSRIALISSNLCCWMTRTSSTQ